MTSAQNTALGRLETRRARLLDQYEFAHSAEAYQQAHDLALALAVVKAAKEYCDFQKVEPHRPIMQALYELGAIHA